MLGTQMYSIAYYAIAAITVVMTTRYLIRLWSPIAKAVQDAASGETNSLKTAPVVKPLNRTIVIVALLLIGLTLLWNIKQHFTASSMADYQNPAEIAEQQKTLNAKMPTPEEADSALADQKQRSEVKPSKEAFKNFYEDMKEEEKKIKDRNK